MKQKPIVWEKDLSQIKESRIQVWIKRNASGEIVGTTGSTLPPRYITPSGDTPYVSLSIYLPTYFDSFVL